MNIMNMQELKQLIYKGEKVDIECKEAESNVQLCFIARDAHGLMEARLNITV